MLRFVYEMRESPTMGHDTDELDTQDPADDEVPMMPAASVGYMLYPWAVQLILAVPPANDRGDPPFGR